VQPHSLIWAGRSGYFSHSLFLCDSLFSLLGQQVKITFHTPLILCAPHFPLDSRAKVAFLHSLFCLTQSPYTFFSLIFTLCSLHFYFTPPLTITFFLNSPCTLPLPYTRSCVPPLTVPCTTTSTHLGRQIRILFALSFSMRFPILPFRPAGEDHFSHPSYSLCTPFPFGLSSQSCFLTLPFLLNTIPLHLFLSYIHSLLPTYLLYTTSHNHLFFKLSLHSFSPVHKILRAPTHYSMHHNLHTFVSPFLLSFVI